MTNCDRVIIHIGTGRTGTSTTQAFLDRNRQSSLAHGYAYVGPLDLVTYPQEAYLNKSRLGFGLHELSQRLKQSGAHSLIWSRESLSPYLFVKDIDRIRMIKDALPASSYRIVVYLRRQDDFLRSAYVQWGLKDKIYPGPTLDFDGWLEEVAEPVLGLDYYALVDPWAEVFGIDNICVRVFEKDQLVGGDVLHDFCSAAGLPAEDYSFELPRLNVSHNLDLYHLLGMYNSSFEEPNFSGEMIGFVDALASDPFFSRKFFSRLALPPSRRIAILQRCEASNRKVAHTFLARTDGVLFREPWPSLEEPYQAYPGMTLEKLVPILMHILQRQEQRIAQLERQSAEGRK